MGLKMEDCYHGESDFKHTMTKSCKVLSIRVVTQSHLKRAQIVFKHVVFAFTESEDHLAEHQ